MTSTRELIAGELRSIRAKKQLTIEDIASKTSLDKMTISRYENNSVSMQIDVLEKILKAYNVDFDIFFKNIYANKQNKWGDKN